MKETKFRGKRKDNGLWIEGDLLHKKNRVWIGMWYKPEGRYVYKEIEVIPETVGQNTGLKDKNGKEIYEGDIIKLPHNDFIESGLHQVHYYEDSFVTSSLSFTNLDIANKNSLTWIISRGAFVVGNIYENTELLNDSQNDG